MKPVDDWFDEYGESHEDGTNKLIHWICVPAIVFSLVGLIGTLPEPRAFGSLPFLSWPILVVGLALIYYFVLSPSLALGMVLVSILLLGTLHHLANSGAPIAVICAGLFVAAWIGQFIGHKIEGKKPSFFKDLQFLLIGPIWLLASLYRRMGLRY